MRVRTLHLMLAAWACVLPALGEAGTTAGGPIPNTRSRPARLVAPTTEAELTFRVACARRLPPGLSASEVAALNGIVTRLRRNDVRGATAAWQTSVASLAGHLRATDLDAIIAWVLRESYLQPTQELRTYADRVAYFSEGKAILQRAVDEAHQSAMPPRATGTITIRRLGALPPFRPGPPPAAEVTSVQMTPQEVDEYTKALEQQLQSVGDDAQHASVDLQSVLQKQAQTLQMLSNVSKTMYDTAIALGRKIGG